MSYISDSVTTSYNLYFFALPIGFALGIGLRSFYAQSLLKRTVSTRTTSRLNSSVFTLIGIIFTVLGLLCFTGMLFYIANRHGTLWDTWTLGFITANIVVTLCFTLFFVFATRLGK